MSGHRAERRQGRLRRRDQRILGVVLLCATVIGVGYLVTLLSSRGVGEVRSLSTDFPRIQSQGLSPGAPEAVTTPWVAAADPGATEQHFEPLADPSSDPLGHAREMQVAELRERFGQAVMMLHAGEHEHAVAALHRVLELDPELPEAHVNMGYALLGLQRVQAARDFFLAAIDLRPEQANAYYGLGIAYEELGDLAGALGAMRNYLHLADETDPFGRHVTRARAALWEWEARLGRGPWGETRGIPPGLTAKDLERDGMGVGVALPQPDGTSRAQERPPTHYER